MNRREAWRSACVETARHVIRQRRRGRLTRPSLRRNGVRIYGIGAAKTGTHSFGEMFHDRVPSGHEIDAHLLIRLLLDRAKSGDDLPLRWLLRLRDRWRMLKVDASQVNMYLIEDLDALYPDSRFVLTIRPPLEWMRSMLDDSLRRDTEDIWKEFREHRFGSRDTYPPQERELERRGLYPLDGYLEYWRDSIERPLGRLPSERLLVVRTDDLAARSAEIAGFCGIPGGEVTAEKAHAFVNRSRFGLLGRIDKSYLADRVENICGDLLRRLFPDYSVAKAIGALRKETEELEG